jgi:hypothetical protein
MIVGEEEKVAAGKENLDHPRLSAVFRFRAESPRCTPNGQARRLLGLLFLG